MKRHRNIETRHRNIIFTMATIWSIQLQPKIEGYCVNKETGPQSQLSTTLWIPLIQALLKLDFCFHFEKKHVTSVDQSVVRYAFCLLLALVVFLHFLPLFFSQRYLGASKTTLSSSIKMVGIRFWVGGNGVISTKAVSWSRRRYNCLWPDVCQIVWWLARRSAAQQIWINFNRGVCQETCFI